MNRNISSLSATAYDLLIIGGGIHGACVAREATLRGLSVALVEKEDFGAATSANSLKVIHGGLRYLQHADFKRARSSIRERSTFLRIAPHLVHPLPVLIPTYGHGLKGREVFAAGLVINDLLGYDRNRHLDPERRLPRSFTISRDRCQALLPGLESQKLTGGAIFFDAQVYNSERLTLAFLRSAAEQGAALANYVEVSSFLKNETTITGVTATDKLTGSQFDIQAKLVVNTAGPWLGPVLGLLPEYHKNKRQSLAKAFNLVIDSPLFDTYAVGFSGRREFRDRDALVKKGSRFFFVASWRGKSLVGTEYVPYQGDPNNFKIAKKEIDGFVNEVNQAYPALALSLEDISFVHAGLVPISGFDPQTKSVQLTKHHRIQDHRHDGVEGLISVLSVKYTTARYVAEQVVDLVFQINDKTKSAPHRSTTTPLYGGDISDFKSFSDAVKQKLQPQLGPKAVQQLIYNYGSAYQEVLDYVEPDTTLTNDSYKILKAEIVHGIRKEMAQTLADIVFRRTELGSAGNPGLEILEFCAGVMQAELGWSETKTQRELQTVLNRFWRNGNDQYNPADNDKKHFRPELVGSAIQ